MTPPERSAERDAAIAAMLPHVPFDGWTRRSLRMGLTDISVSPDDAELLFPGGTADMIEAFCDWADRRMEAAAATLDPALRLHQRVRAVIALRLSRTGRTRRRSAARSRCWRCHAMRGWLRHARRERSMRSGMRPAINRPTSVGTPSEPSLRRCTRQPCCSGYAMPARMMRPRSAFSTGGWLGWVGSARCDGGRKRRSVGSARPDAPVFRRCQCQTVMHITRA